MPNTAISVKKISKDFALPHKRKQTVKSAFLNLFKSNSENTSDETQHALKDISFDIEKGDFFGIVGRNGSGKSTLLKLLAGIYQPNKGAIDVDGKIVPFIELGVGFNPELTGRENVYLNGAILGFSEDEIDGMYDSIVEFSELERFMDQKLKNYSSGMQVRLAFSVAIKAKADILLIDEVLAVGDSDFQGKCYEYFKKLKRDKTTVVFVSHDMSAVRQYCNKGVLIEAGNIIEAGTSEQIAKAYDKLFSAPEDDEPEEEVIIEGERWGNKKITITQAKLSRKTYGEENSDIEFEMSYRANGEVDDPVFGFRIRDARGEAIVGTNTQIEKIKAQKLSVGQKGSIVWRVPNIFTQGSYVVDPAIVYSGGSKVADWWDGAASFKVKNSRVTPYPVTPKIKVDTK